jgi:hypothetical protein
MFLAWNALMAFIWVSIDPAWKGLVVVAALLVDVFVAVWAVMVARREMQSGDWVLHLERSGEPGGMLRGFVETPLVEKPRKGVRLIFVSHSGDPFMGTSAGKLIRTGLSASQGGSVMVPVELSIPTGIPMPGYYRDLYIDGEGGTIQWELLCRVGPPLLGYTARFEVPGMAIHHEEASQQSPL